MNDIYVIFGGCNGVVCVYEASKFGVPEYRSVRSAAASRQARVPPDMAARTAAAAAAAAQPAAPTPRYAPKSRAFTPLRSRVPRLHPATS